MSKTLIICFVFIAHHYLALADQQRIDSLTNSLTGNSDTLEVQTLLDLAAEFEYVDRNQAREYTKEALALSNILKYQIGQIRSFYELAIISFLNGDRAEAKSFLDDGLEVANLIDNQIYLANGYFHLSHYHEETGNYSEAIDFLEKALSIFQKKSNQKKISQCYSSFGGINKTLGNYESALDYYFKALAIKEEIKDSRGISIIYSNIGGVYLLTSVYSNVGDSYLLTSKLVEAQKYFTKALEIDRSNNDNEGIVYNLTKVGVTFQKSGQFEKALDYYDSALVMARDLDFKIDQSILLGNIGSTLRALQRDQESLDYLFSALELKEKLQRDGSAAHTCNDICETYMAMNNYEAAKKYALRAIDLAEDVDVNQHRVGLYLLADCEYELMDFQSAFDHLQQANVITDSIFTIESEARMHEMEVKYQTEQKEQEILNLTQAKEAAEFRRNTYIFAGLALSIFLLLLYNQQRLRSKKNRQLFQKEKELDRMKSRFFANISHEFRTPLTLILGPINDILEKVQESGIKRQLEVMHRNARRLLDLINQLLDLSKVESGQLKLETKRQDLIPVIKGVVMSFHSAVEQKHIQVELDVHPDELRICFDRPKIETVLTNLLSNALKFTPENGTIVISSTLVCSSAKNGNYDHFRLSVKDTGQGIPANDLKHIFNRFYQSDTNQIMQHEGSGIGLALTKELVELHKGAISAKSIVGEGTTIQFEIPINLDETISVDSQIPEKAKYPGVIEYIQEDAEGTVIESNHNIEKDLVLVIEDHKDVRKYIYEVLHDKYNIILAENGEEGIEKAIEHIPDLIISDVMMPKKDGYAVSRVLKNDERTSHIPIVLLTAKSGSDDKIEGLRTMVDDYVTKPFVPEELLVRAENLIAGRKILRQKYSKEGVLKPREIATSSVDEKFLKKLVEYVEQNIGNERFGVEQLSRELAMSRSQVHRKLTALIDQSPNQFIRSFRLQRAHDLLIQKSATASEIAYQVGFNSPSYFTKCFHEQFGYTPSEAFV